MKVPLKSVYFTSFLPKFALDYFCASNYIGINVTIRTDSPLYDYFNAMKLIQYHNPVNQKLLDCCV
jgi:hypothetical protein